MSINNRFTPSHPAGQSITYGLDFANILPQGVTLDGVQIGLYTNTVPPAPSSDMQQGEVAVVGRRAYTELSGGVAGTDYQVLFTATDNLGNTWPRTVLLLCAATS